jgi:sn-glycerol 3-phosphate transport system substrate-binding protein
MKNKVIAALLSVAMVATTMVGCGSSTGAAETTEDAAETTEDTAEEDAAATEAAEETLSADASGQTITFWHSMGGVNGEAIDTLVNKFNEENELGITVQAEYQGEYDDSINKLKSAQLGNMGADLVQIYDIGTRFMIDSGWVVPMQDLIDADGYDITQIEPNIAAYYTVDNELYSMPFNSSTPILYYNKTMFDAAGITEVPTSLPGIAEVADDLVSKGGAGEAISLGIYGWFFEQFTCKQGASYVDQGNGREAAATAVEFDTNGSALNTLTEWKALYDAGYAPNVGRGGDSGLTDFSSGKSAMTLGSTASLKQILQDVNGSFEVGTAYFPSVTAEDKGGVSIGGASLWALENGDDAKKAATWEFIKFLVSPESQAYWNAQTGYFPVTTAAYDEQVFKDNVAQYPQFQTAIDQLHDSAPEYAGALLSVFPEARSIVETEIENMLNGNQSAEEAVDKMASDINNSIEEYNLLNE